MKLRATEGEGGDEDEDQHEGEDEGEDEGKGEGDGNRGWDEGGIYAPLPRLEHM